MIPEEYFKRFYAKSRHDRLGGMRLTMKALFVRRSVSARSTLRSGIGVSSVNDMKKR